MIPREMRCQRMLGDILWLEDRATISDHIMLHHSSSVFTFTHHGVGN